MAATLNNLAVLYHQMRDYKKALSMYRSTLEIIESILGPQHPGVATTLKNLAELYESMGDYGKALPLYQRALDICEKVLGPNHPNTAIIKNNPIQVIRDIKEKERN